MKMESVYNNLKAIDVRPKAEKKGRADYLSWAHAWDMLKSNYPQAQRIIYEQPETGLNYFTDGKTAYVKVGIVVNDMEHIDMLPVMDHRNKSIPVDKIDSFEVNKTIQGPPLRPLRCTALDFLCGQVRIYHPNPPRPRTPPLNQSQRIRSALASRLTTRIGARCSSTW